MFYVHHPKVFVLDPVVTVPADIEGIFYSMERCAECATPASPAVWQAELIKRHDDGSRVVRLVRFVGHARKIGLKQASPLRLTAA